VPENKFGSDASALVNLNDDEIPGSQGDFLISFYRLARKNIYAVFISIYKCLRMAGKVERRSRLRFIF